MKFKKTVHVKVIQFFTLGLASLIFTFLLPHTLSAQAYSNHSVKITSSKIKITGETNVAKFQCDMNQPAVEDSILVKNIWSDFNIEFEGLLLQYIVKDFGCNIGAMNRDFQELLRSNEFPYMYLQLHGITINRGHQTFEELDVTADVEIHLAGVSRRVEVKNGKVLNHTPARLTLTGEKELAMSTFGIDPPTKFFGMIQVTDLIQVDFEIGMEVSRIK